MLESVYTVASNNSVAENAFVCCLYRIGLCPKRKTTLQTSGSLEAIAGEQKSNKINAKKLRSRLPPSG